MSIGGALGACASGYVATKVIENEKKKYNKRKKKKKQNKKI